MRAVIISGTRDTDVSPRHGREDHEFWGHTHLSAKWWGGKLEGWTRWFGLHPLTKTDRFEGLPHRRPTEWQWYLKQDGTRPIYLQDPKESTHPAEAHRLFNQVPGATVFPIHDVRRHFLVNGLPESWFYCQMGLMLAKAIMEGPERIVLNGVGKASHMAFQHAHRCIPYWIAYARGRGIDVVVEGRSTYSQPTKIYGYEHVRFPDLEPSRQQDPPEHYRRLSPMRAEVEPRPATRVPKNHPRYRKAV